MLIKIKKGQKAYQRVQCEKLNIIPDRIVYQIHLCWLAIDAIFGV